MSDNNSDHFYLENTFPEPDKIFSFDYKGIDEIVKDCVFVFDTNVLLVPFDTSSKNISEIKRIFKDLKGKNQLYLPARVAREFAKNRGKKLGELFLKIRQTKNQLNSGHFKVDDYPLLENHSEFKKLKKTFEKGVSIVKQAREQLDNIESLIKGWTWNDNVSNMYTEIFTPDIIIEVKKTEDELVKDLEFRSKHSIAPGYNDKNKTDGGIGDLIIWNTILELGSALKKDIVFVTDDQKNDWFYKQDKESLYPKFELFDEYRRATNGKSIHLLSFPEFLLRLNAKEETIAEVKESIERGNASQYSRSYNHNDLIEGMEVEHKRFGKGTVKRLYLSSAGKEWIEIDFENGVSKNFILKYCDLHIPDSFDNALLKFFNDSSESND